MFYSFNRKTDLIILFMNISCKCCGNTLRWHALQIRDDTLFSNKPFFLLYSFKSVRNLFPKVYPLKINNVSTEEEMYVKETFAAHSTYIFNYLRKIPENNFFVIFSAW